MQERLGIGIAQFKLLAMLQDNPLVQQRYLANGLGQTEASISRQIKILSEKGLITVQVNPKLRRQHGISLSAKGHKLYHVAQDILDQYELVLIHDLSEKQLALLRDTLTTLHAKVCASGRAFACDTSDHKMN